MLRGARVRMVAMGAVRVPAVIMVMVMGVTMAVAVARGLSA
jgi:hypothetical protein